MTLVLLSLASFRLWRFVGRDDWPPCEWFRSQLDERAENERGWVWHYVRTLVTCPWCLGTWVAFAVVAWADVWVGLESPILWALAVACTVGLIGSYFDE